MSNVKWTIEFTILDITKLIVRKITYQCHRTLLVITLVHIQSTAAINDVKDKNTNDGHLLLPPK